MELKKVMDHADAVKESVINHRRKIHTFADKITVSLNAP